MSTARKRISIVTPVFNEEPNVRSCRDAVRAVFEQKLPNYDYEHLFCDNASTDRTLDLLREIAASDPKVKVIANSRNYGPSASLLNGVRATDSDACIPFVPADIQDPPDLIPEFVRLWEAGHEVVYGIRQEREEGLIIKTLRRVFYRLVNRFSEFPIPIDAGEFQLLDRKVVNALKSIDDHNPYVRGMIAYCGFKSVGVPYRWTKRARGFSKATWYLLIDQGLNGLISFSKVPLRFALLGGFCIAAASLLYALFNLAVGILFYRQVAAPGIATLIVAMFFFAGVQLFLTGLLGEYIGAIHFQVRKRPLVIERERINFAP